MSLFWSKNALFWSEMHHMLLYSVVLYCTVFYCIAWYIFCYLMVLHCNIWYSMLSILHAIACYSLRRAGCVLQDTYSLNVYLVNTGPLAKLVCNQTYLGETDPVPNIFWQYGSAVKYYACELWLFLQLLQVAPPPQALNVT